MVGLIISKIHVYYILLCKISLFFTRFQETIPYYYSFTVLDRFYILRVLYMVIIEEMMC